MSNEKTVTIVVNGHQKTVAKQELTFEEVVNLAFNPPPSGDGVQIAVTYSRGHGNKPEGNLAPGESVKVKEGMVFDVTPTNRS